MHDEHGAVTGLIGVACDITTRKRDEQALRDSETRLELALAAARMGVWSIDLSDEPVFWSPEIYDMTGHTRAPSGFEEFLDLVLPDDREMVREAVNTAIRTRTRYQATFRFRRPDGEIRWLSHNGEGNYDADGNYTGMRGAVFDITDRMAAEAARRTSEERYRHFLDVLPDAVYVVEDECITYCNPAFVSLLGAGGKEALIGTSMLDMHSAQDHEPVRQCIDDTLAGVAPAAPLERRIQRVDGRTVPVLVAATQVADAERRAVLFVLRDLTHQHRVESDLRQAHKMEALGQVAGGVAHDFNNLLTVILGYSDMLQDQFSDGDPRRQFASDIRRASGRAADLTRQLLTFSRRTVVAPKVVDVNAVVKDMNRMLRRVLREDVELTVGIDSNTPKVFIDPGSLEQIVMNLSVNARDAMPNGGALTITTGHAWRDGGVDVAGNALAPGDYATVTVSDTGDGIDPDVRAHIFEPFFTTKGAGKGTGLGLAVVQGLVEQNRGHILLETAPGRGTSFTIALPMVDQALAVAPVERARAPRGGGETILVVEDEEPVRRLAVIALASGGYRVLEAADGRAAVEVFDRHRGPIDLLLTVVVMPHIGGRELSMALIAKQPSLRVIFTSGYADDAVLRRGITRSDVPFLAKPYTPSGVLQKVRDVIDRPPAVNPSRPPPV
jgi:PAS domain S-box-containing protein